MSDAASDTYRYEQDQNLSAAIREAIAAERDDMAADVDLGLYDDLNPEAIDSLVRRDARPQTSVELHTNAAKVTLWGDGDFDVQVLDEDARRD